MKPDFSGLLEDAVQLAAQTAVGMPPLQRSLPQIDDISRRMAATAAAGADARTKASYLMAGQNFDADKLSRNLDAIDIKTTFEPLEALADTDVEGFLRHEHRLLILTAIEESNRETAAQARQSYLAGMKSEWEATKRKLMEGLGHRTGSSLAAGQELTLAVAQPTGAAATPLRPGQAPAGRYAPAGNLNVRPAAALKRAGEEYAGVARALAQRRVERKAFGALAMLKRAADRIDDPDPVRKADVARCWDMLASMLGERGVTEAGDFAGEALTEGAWRAALAEPDAAALLRLARGARAFLERQFLELAVQKKVRENLQVARVGGTPGTLSQVRGYINILRTGRDWAPEFEQDSAVWPEIFYSLRCGDLDSAIALAEANPACGMLLPLLKDAKLGRIVPETAKRDVRAEFARMSVPGYRNLYRQAVFNAVGRVDARTWSQRLYLTQEDFMWFRLTLIDEGSAAADLGQLQEYIRELGPKHFAAKSVLRYAHVLLLSGQFEAGVEFLAQHEAFLPEAAHAAAALAHYGALREAPPGTPDDAPLLSEGPPAAPGARRRPQLHSGALLRAYARSHVPAKDSQLAADYLSLCLTHDDPRPLAELVLRTGDMARLLGAVLPDGSRVAGYLEKYVGADGARAVAAAAGREAEAAGQQEDAARLYLLARAHEEAVRVCSDALRPLAAQPPSPRRDALLRFVREVLGAVEKAGATAGLAGGRVLSTFAALLAVADMCDLGQLGRHKEALEAAQRMGLVALREEQVQPLVAQFRGLEDAVRERVPDVALGAMAALFRLHQEAKPRPGSLPDPAREALVADYRRQARALLSFVGSLGNYVFPTDTCAALVRMEAQMA